MIQHRDCSRNKPFTFTSSAFFTCIWWYFHLSLFHKHQRYILLLIDSAFFGVKLCQSLYYFLPRQLSLSLLQYQNQSVLVDWEYLFLVMLWQIFPYLHRSWYGNINVMIHSRTLGGARDFNGLLNECECVYFSTYCFSYVYSAASLCFLQHPIDYHMMEILR